MYSYLFLPHLISTVQFYQSLLFVITGSRSHNICSVCKGFTLLPYSRMNEEYFPQDSNIHMVLCKNVAHSQCFFVW